jgi:hypothetical protein
MRKSVHLVCLSHYRIIVYTHLFFHVKTATCFDYRTLNNNTKNVYFI